MNEAKRLNVTFSQLPLLRVSPDGTTQFGTIKTGSSAQRSFVVTNASSVPLTGTASVAAPFSISAGGSYTLAPGASQTIKVLYSPTAPGKDSATITFPGGTGATRQLTGAALDDPTATSGTITGRVSDSVTHNPINKASVTAFVNTNIIESPKGPGAISQFKDGQGGTYAITGVTPNSHYHVQAVADGYYLGYYLPDLSIGAGQTLNNINIELTPLPPTQTTVLGTPVVLVRGRGANVYPDTTWNSFTSQLAGQNPKFTELWDCNRDAAFFIPDNNSNLQPVINGERGISYNAGRLLQYLASKALDYKNKSGGFYPSQINIVAHSMGGLIVRQALDGKGYLLLYDANGQPFKLTVKNVVMLATPHAGSYAADWVLHPRFVPLSEGINLYESLFKGFDPGVNWESTRNLRTAVARQFSMNKPWPNSVNLQLLAATGGYATTDEYLKYSFNWTLSELDDRHLGGSPEIYNDGVVTQPSVGGDYYEERSSDALSVVSRLSTFNTTLVAPISSSVTDVQVAGQALDHFHVLNDNKVIEAVASVLKGNSWPAASQPMTRMLRGVAKMQSLPRQLVESRAGTVLAGSTGQWSVISDASTKIKFQLLASGSDVAFKLQDPSGNIVDSTTPQTNPNVQYSATINGSNGVMASYDINSPALGSWNVIVDSTGVNEPQITYLVTSFGDSNVALFSQTGVLFNQKEDAVVACALADLSNNPPIPLQGASVTAAVQLPDGSTTTLNMLDDGLHNDGAPSDGIYAAVLPGVSQAGQYSIRYAATAPSGQNQPLQRVASGGFNVSSENGSILGDPVFATVDTGGDGIADSMQAKCWVNPKVAGSYILSGQFVDASSTLQIPASSSFYADGSGPMTVSLFFDLATIHAANANGEFHIENLQLFEVAESGIAWLDAYHGTSALQIGPKITVQPHGQVVPKAGKAVFSVTAQSTTTLHYQWKRNGQAIASAVNATLTLAQAAVADAGNYTVVVSDDTGVVTSTVAALVVGIPPFVSFKGTYQGLIQPDSLSNALSGRITVSFAGAGTFTGTVVLGGKSYSVRGTFDQFGMASAAIGTTGLRIELQLDVTNHSDQLTGKITDNGNVVANAQTDRPPTGLTMKKPSLLAGRYTLLLPPDAAHPEATYPQGNGYATLTVSFAGLARIVGVLGDSSAISVGGSVTKNGQLPVYLPLYAMKGSVSGWLTLHDAKATNQVDGALNWFKPATLTPRWFPEAFSGLIAVEGSGYIAPPKQPQILPAGSATFTISDGDVTVNPTVKNLTIAALNKIKIVGNEKFTMTPAPATGLFTGTFYDTDNRLRTFNGAVLQKQNSGAGLFKGNGQTGSVELSR